MSANSKAKACAYCGSSDNLTRDHVPPKSLFREPFPSNMITVPACRVCHDRITIDDEYFLISLGLVLSSDKGEHAKYITAKIKRALRRPEAKRLMSALRKSAKPAEVHSKGDIYLGRMYAIPFDWVRLQAFGKRILVALHFRETGVPVADTYDPTVHLSWLQKERNILESPKLKELIGILSRSPKVVVGQNTFQYWCARVDDDPNSSFWYVLIAEEFGFFGFICRKEN